jgi:DNA-binding winged helix-turn-helix (wHTH) protein/TolB-like protein/Tfp pilus assembly protein PilF
MSRKTKTFYDFGPFRVDAGEQRVWRGGEAITLTPKAFGVLLMLVEHAGQTLLKDELMKGVWPDSYVEENNLADNVSTLRKVLGDDPKRPKYIETVPRRGYRFVAEVAEVREGDVELVVAERTRARVVIEEESGPGGAGRPAEVAEGRAQSVPASRAAFGAGRRLRPVVIACLLLAGASLVAAYLYLSARRGASANNSTRIRSIAVLPFKPLLAGDRDESLEMGMADTLIARLGGVGRLTVRPINAVRKYTSLDDEAVKSGRELMVDAVLDGNIQKAGDRVRVTVRLVRVEQGETLWTKQFDEKFTDIFEVQDSISRRIGESLALELSGEEKERLTKRGTENTEAYQLYLKGRYFWNKFMPAENQKAAEYFKQAIAQDPGYAQAHSGLANAYAVAAVNNWLPSREAYPQAREEATKALELDGSLAEAQLTVGALTMFYDLDWAKAEGEMRRALELNPNYVDTYSVYSYLLSCTGRLDEGIKMARRGLDVDPLSVPLSDDTAGAYYLARRYDESLGQLRRSIDLDANHAGAYIFLGQVYEQQGKYDDAIAAYQKAIERSERTSNILGLLGHAYAVSGRRREALSVLDELKEMSGRKKYVSPYDLAVLYTGLGERGQAIDQLYMAYEARAGWIINLKIEPLFDPLRADPRYLELLRRMNLTP